MTKSIFASKTLWFNGITILFAVVTYFGWAPDASLVANTSKLLVTLAPVLNFGLRFWTTKPVSL